MKRTCYRTIQVELELGLRHLDHVCAVGQKISLAPVPELNYELYRDRGP